MAGEIGSYENPQNLLITRPGEARVGQPVEKEQWNNLLTSQITNVVQKRIESWPPSTCTKEREVTGTAGVKTPVGRRMQVGAALRGQYLGAERVSAETVATSESVVNIPILRLHLALPASPTILAFSKFYKRATEILGVLDQLQVSNINSVLKSAKIQL